MTIRKVGGIYFWNVGRIGGSIHVSKRAVKHERKASGFDWFGASVCGALALAAVLSIQPRVELQAVTASGDVYIAGSGDTCADAFKGAVYPADWRELNCVKVYL